MRTAIVTGASSGLGRELARQTPEVFPEVERIWLIARRRDRLADLAAALGGEEKVRILPLDLCDAVGLASYQAALSEECPEVVLLVNDAGLGHLGDVGEGPLAVQTRMIDLNVRALTAVTHLALPWMPEGGRILDVSSIAAFCPTPHMTVYSATKAYVSAFTRGLGKEIRPRGLTATAVCPGPMGTEFLDVGDIEGRSRMFALLPYCDQVRVAHGALCAARAGQGVYTPRLCYKIYRLMAKLLPSALLSELTRV